MIDFNTNSYLALLRGINVGGKNIIKMVDLKKCFEAMGFTGVATYIQSGNVLFKYSDHELTKITTQIEKKLSDVFDYKSKVVLVTEDQLEVVVSNPPEGFGEKPEDYRYDVLFLKQPLDSDEVMMNITTKKGVDHVWQGERVIYFSRLIKKASSSHLRKIVSLPLYKNITIRNWNTTTKLYAMMKN